ncbi:hypothetical protein RFI_36881 [Reticulomyxa filosa]|uniref:Uncharacterized protein n=1 Tax=Reticulomyxa filosa TaxID=46433 RepID=X6LG58_RETFI|nr:hypothetical protein RFI_36881 [Reticulomyxa filosa]|eukprot:ETO00559.1 hypothetical protein RFI_36881 [Reticulomyxa filosa]
MKCSSLNSVYLLSNKCLLKCYSIYTSSYGNFNCFKSKFINSECLGICGDDSFNVFDLPSTFTLFVLPCIAYLFELDDIANPYNLQQFFSQKQRHDLLLSLQYNFLIFSLQTISNLCIKALSSHGCNAFNKINFDHRLFKPPKLILMFLNKYDKPYKQSPNPINLKLKNNEPIKKKN